MPGVNIPEAPAEARIATRFRHEHTAQARTDTQGSKGLAEPEAMVAKYTETLRGGSQRAHQALDGASAAQPIQATKRRQDALPHPSVLSEPFDELEVRRVADFLVSDEHARSGPELWTQP